MTAIIKWFKVRLFIKRYWCLEFDFNGNWCFYLVQQACQRMDYGDGSGEGNGYGNGSGIG